jgi:hypothetical protein
VTTKHTVIDVADTVADTVIDVADTVADTVIDVADAIFDTVDTIFDAPELQQMTQIHLLCRPQKPKNISKNNKILKG